MKVKVAVARKMLTTVWHVMKEGVPYRDYRDAETKDTAYCKAIIFVVSTTRLAN